MFQVLSDKRNANQNDPEIPPSEWLRSKLQVTTHVGEDVEKEKHSSTLVGLQTGLQSGYSGNQSMGSSKN